MEAEGKVKDLTAEVAKEKAHAEYYLVDGDDVVEGGDGADGDGPP